MNYAFDFKEKGVLITGAASGIGLETTRAFLQNGAVIYMADYNEKNLAEKSEELKKEFPESDITYLCNRGLCCYYAEEGSFLVGFEG